MTKSKRRMENILHLDDLTITAGYNLEVNDIMKILHFINNSLEGRVLEITTENFGFQTSDGVIFEYWETPDGDKKNRIYRIIDVSKNFIFSAEGFLRMNLFHRKFVEGYLGRSASPVEDIN